MRPYGSQSNQDPEGNTKACDYDKLLHQTVSPLKISLLGKSGVSQLQRQDRQHLGKMMKEMNVEKVKAEAAPEPPQLPDLETSAELPDLQKKQIKKRSFFFFQLCSRKIESDDDWDSLCQNLKLHLLIVVILATTGKRTD